MARKRDDADGWMFDPELAAINRSLQRELREEAEELESIVEESELRARDFAFVAREIRNSGDEVSITTSHRVFTGTVVYAAGDFVTVLTHEFEVDIHLEDIAYMRRVRKGRRGGRPAGDGPGTFEMRLLERQSHIHNVEIGFRQIDSTLFGRITAVSQDHAIVVDSNRSECAVPIAGMSYVIRRGQQAYR